MSTDDLVRTLKGLAEAYANCKSEILLTAIGRLTCQIMERVNSPRPEVTDGSP